MRFPFEVGLNEKHWVEIRFDAFWQRFSAFIDGIERMSERPLIAFGFTFTYEFYVGIQEVNHVRIVRTRKVLFSIFRPNHYHIYINGILVYNFEK
jgi:hypothetical protein